jgi:putative tributyrin esterase
MALAMIQFRAKAIGKATSLNVIVPETPPGPWPVLYLLHGFSDDHTAWCRRTSIERYVEGLGLMVVMPDAQKSFYCNDPRPDGLNYEDHIVKDVVGFVDRTFDTIADRAGRAIAGLSMGGYGAFMLSMRHPEMFCAASSHSGALGFGHIERSDKPEIDAIMQARPKGDYDCFVLAERMVDHPQRPVIRFDCGTDDYLLAHDRLFHDHLHELGLPHTYQEFPGAHSWAYWDEHIRDTLTFLGDQLPLQQAT